MAILTHPINSTFDLHLASCSPDVSVGDFVYVHSVLPSGQYFLKKCDITDQDTLPPIGLVTQKVSSTTCTVQSEGTISGLFINLVPNKAYYLDADSRPAYPIPALTGNFFLQKVGIAISSDILLISLDETAILRRTP